MSPTAAPAGSRLPRSFFVRDPQLVAPDLLGCVVTVLAEGSRVSVRLTEVEAYAGVGEDAASHAHRGRTPRNAAMFGPPGTLYVYFSYGMHWCANLVCWPEGRAGAVLLRAGEVVSGEAAARARRPAARGSRELAQGPARLARALGVDRGWDGVDVCDPVGAVAVTVGEAGTASGPVARGARVGVSAGAETAWRFWLDGEPTVSRYRAGGPRRRASGAGG